MTDKGIITGKFTEKEDQFIRDNYLVMTDKEIGKSLNRDNMSIINRRKKLCLNNKRILGSSGSKSISKASYLSTLTEDERTSHFRKELKTSSTYKEVKKILDKDELSLYEDKYVDFMIDPTIETMTSMEKDTWHEMVMAQIRIFRYMREEKAVDKDGRKVSRAKEIDECQKVVQSCQKSLNVERSQRLKGQNDTDMKFASLIRELKDPSIRRELGYEAVMLKYIAEKHYNERLGHNIISGNDKKYNVDDLFIDGVEPSGLIGKFT